MKRAVFLDRDGVINRKPPEGQYVTRWEDVEILSGVPEAIALLTQVGFCVLAVSNQRCVAKGLLTIRELESINDCIREQLVAEGALLIKVYYCPHDYQPPCDCRKPAPGLILTAAREQGIDLGKSWMIGDSDIDVQAGKTAGCRTVKILNSDTRDSSGADLQARTLLDAAHEILALETPP
jgi:D-glycero-D-manno-heptose 1,7-bisphosphate phosphatase